MGPVGGLSDGSRFGVVARSDRTSRHRGVGYEVYIRSFADSSGDGIGDLEGVRRHLDHLVWLGVDAVWVTPFYESPGHDHGYDVSDYVGVNPIHGSLDDFDRLVSDAHDKGLKVIVDIVPNHSSVEHTWFREAVSDPSGPYRDFYIWRDPAPDGGPPNNWVSHFGGPAWTLDPGSDQYYCHLFLPEQPDLNWDNPGVLAAFDEILRFWCDRGVDGFRVDVAYGLAKDPEFRDNPQLRSITDDMGSGEIFEAFRHQHDIEQPRSLTIFRRWHEVVRPYDAILIGEVRTGDPELMTEYLGDGDLLDLVFYLEPGRMRWEPQVLLERLLAMRAAVPFGIAWVIDSHDRSRSPSRFGGGRRGALRSLAVTTLLMALDGMPFLYQGQELGLTDGVIDPADMEDPITTRNEGAVGRDGARTPMPWNDGPGNGFTAGAVAWLPAEPRLSAEKVAVQRDDPDSLLNRHRRLLAIRRSLPDLRHGEMEVFVRAATLVGLRRGRVIVVSNLGESTELVALPEDRWSVVFSSRRPAGGAAAGSIEVEAETTIILEVAGATTSATV